MPGQDPRVEHQGGDRCLRFPCPCPSWLHIGSALSALDFLGSRWLRPRCGLDSTRTRTHTYTRAPVHAHKHWMVPRGRSLNTTAHLPPTIHTLIVAYSTHVVVDGNTCSVCSPVDNLPSIFLGATTRKLPIRRQTQNIWRGSNLQSRTAYRVLAETDWERTCSQNIAAAAG